MVHCVLLAQSAELRIVICLQLVWGFCCNLQFIVLLVAYSLLCRFAAVILCAMMDSCMFCAFLHGDCEYTVL